MRKLSRAGCPCVQPPTRKNRSHAQRTSIHRTELRDSQHQEEKISGGQKNEGTPAAPASAPTQLPSKGFKQRNKLKKKENIHFPRRTTTSGKDGQNNLLSGAMDGEVRALDKKDKEASKCGDVAVYSLRENEELPGARKGKDAKTGY